MAFAHKQIYLQDPMETLSLLGQAAYNRSVSKMVQNESAQ